MKNLKVSELNCGYGSKSILENVNFSVEAGMCMGVVGANGCGKTTLLEILAGIKKQQQGDIFIDDKPICKADFAEKIGYVPQENMLIEECSVIDNLRLWYQDRTLLQKELETGFLCELGVNQFLGKSCRKLSGGMKKKVSIACALANKADILILDEPCAALDLPSKRQLRMFLKTYAEQGHIVIMATHEETDFEICNRILKMDAGKCEVYTYETGFNEV